MPVYLVSLSQKALYEEFIEAPNEYIAIAEAMKLRRKPQHVHSYDFSVDGAEEWDADLPGISPLKATSG